MNIAYTIGTMALLLIGALMGHAFLPPIGVQDYKQQAITNGCAEYDSQTGKWEWLPVTREAE